MKSSIKVRFQALSGWANAVKYWTMGIVVLVGIGVGASYLMRENYNLDFVTQAIRQRTVNLTNLIAGGGQGGQTANPFSCNMLVPGPFQISVAECNALVDLFEKTHGSNRFNRQGWNLNPAPCDRYGVDCLFNGNTTNVVSVKLGYNNLVGPLSDLLSELSELQVLELNNNSISGPLLAAGLGSLTELRTLNLEQNQLNGSIPVSFGDLGEIEYLNLSENNIDGSVPAQLGNLDKLKILKINNNQISGPLPSELANMNDLETFYLNDNQICGFIPDSFVNSNVQLEPGTNKLMKDGYSPAMASWIADHVFDWGNQNSFNCSPTPPLAYSLG